MTAFPIPNLDYGAPLFQEEHCFMQTRKRRQGCWTRRLINSSSYDPDEYLARMGCLCEDEDDFDEVLDDGELDCLLVARVTWLDLILPTIKKALEVTTVVCLIFYGYYLWAALTLVILALPGTLECLYWIMSFDCHANTRSCCLWNFFFNPIFFPFTMIAW